MPILSTDLIDAYEGGAIPYTDGETSRRFLQQDTPLKQHRYRIDLHCRQPFYRFSLDRINQHGLALKHIGNFETVADAESIARLGMAVEIVITPAAERAEAERKGTA